MVVERMGFKRFPSEGSTQSILELTPQIRAWTKVEDIASIYVQLPRDGWLETADPPKWDPRNRETADHSMPYVIAVALIDGDVYMDPSRQNASGSGGEEAHGEDHHRSGPQLHLSGSCPSHGAHQDRRRNCVKQTLVHLNTPMTRQEIVAKFNRVCAFMSVRTNRGTALVPSGRVFPRSRDIAEPIRASLYIAPRIVKIIHGQHPHILSGKGHPLLTPCSYSIY